MSARERAVWIVSVAFGAGSLALFTHFWFSEARLPAEETGRVSWIGLGTFALLTVVVWHRILMDGLNHVLSRRLPRYRAPQPPAPGLKVAFITTFVPSSEPLSMLRETLVAILAVDYAHDTWVLDEGDDPAARALCDELGVKHFSRKGIATYNQPHGRFAARTKGGNHNAWYDAHGSEYEFVAQIDTDFIPTRDFLAATLGYFADERTAWVITPQIYGNTAASVVARGAAQQQFTFYGPILRAMDARGMAMMLGANHVVRVAALESVGFYEGHITEDLATGIKLHAAGWRSHYVPRALAVGEGPTTWLAYFNQQARWAYGCFALLFQVTPRSLRGLGWRRGAFYVWLQMNYFSGLAFALGTVLIALYFFTGLTPATLPLAPLIAAYLPYLAWRQVHHLWMQRFHVRPGEESGLLLPGRLVGTIVQPIYALALVYVLVGKRLVFKVTPKGGGDEAALTPMAVFRTHLAVAVVMAASLVSGAALGYTGWPMVFWGTATIIAMLAIPAADLPQRAVLLVADARRALAAVPRPGARALPAAAVMPSPLEAAGLSALAPGPARGGARGRHRDSVGRLTDRRVMLGRTRAPSPRASVLAGESSHRAGPEVAPLLPR
ncbi:glycosyltransferase family 2 protein [Modestobacter sp. SSW1-42]|uniref:glycosyltransferase family 2 protein n=1 Tax=Modestobacter sp. SSW1-42 TaxID=596372 RepID=UPI0039861DCE